MCLLTAHSYFANDGLRLKSANHEHNRWTLIRVIDALADQVAKNIRSFSYFAIPTRIDSTEHTINQTSAETFTLRNTEVMSSWSL